MDFRIAMSRAHRMVWQWGMGKSGYVGDYTVIPESQLSEEIKTALNNDANQIIQECLKEVEKLLRDENAIFERFAKELLAREELEYDEIEAIFSEYGKPNPRTVGKYQPSDSSFKPNPPGPSAPGENKN